MTSDSGLKGIDHRGIGLRDRQYAILDAKTLGQLGSIRHRMVGRELRWHKQSLDILLAESLDRQAGNNSRVDTSRKAYASLLVATLVEIVAKTEHCGVVDVACALVCLEFVRQLARFVVSQSVINRKVLLERLHQKSDIALAIDYARSAIVDNLARATNVVDEGNGLRLDKGEVVHRLVAVRHKALAITTGVDTEDNVDIAINILQEAEVVTHDDGNVLAGDANNLRTLAAIEEAHLTTRGDVCLGNVALDLSVLDNHCGTLRTVLHKDRRSHHCGDIVAV